MIIWLTGISGSGKSTLANSLLNLLKKNNYKFVSIDGDEIRKLYGNDLGYDLFHRKKQIKRIQNLCKFLDKQGIDIIASALYFSEDIAKWNRLNFSRYYEIYIKASVSLVSSIDEKGIYKKFKLGKEKNIVGIDIKWNAPKKAFLVIDRDVGISKQAMLKTVIKNIPELKKIKC